MVGMIAGGGPVGGGGNPGGGTVIGNPKTEKDKLNLPEDVQNTSFRLEMNCCVTYWAAG